VDLRKKASTTGQSASCCFQLSTDCDLGKHALRKISQRQDMDMRSADTSAFCRVLRLTQADVSSGAEPACFTKKQPIPMAILHLQK